MCLLEVDLRPSWTAKCVEACALALGAPPCLHKPVQLMVCPLPSCIHPSSLLVHPQTHSVHSPSAHPPRMCAPFMDTCALVYSSVPPFHECFLKQVRPSPWMHPP
jgi:hypothetical protein